jgi:hypothetical protein
MSDGWIKLHRSIKEHWIFNDSDKFKAWTLMLMEVNHCKQKVIIRGEVYECDAGQSLYSYDTWAKLFGKSWTKQKVRTFFSLLEKDKMLTHEGLHYTTRITICNYKTYQGNVVPKQEQYNTPSNTPITHGQHTDNTPITPNKNENNDKNARIKQPVVCVPEKLSSIVGFDEAWNQWIDHLREKRKRPTTGAMNAQLKRLSEMQNPIETILWCIEKNWQGIYHIDVAKDITIKSPIPSLLRFALEKMQWVETIQFTDPSLCSLVREYSKADPFRIANDKMIIDDYGRIKSTNPTKLELFGFGKTVGTKCII